MRRILDRLLKLVSLKIMDMNEWRDDSTCRRYSKCIEVFIGCWSVCECLRSQSRCTSNRKGWGYVTNQPGRLAWLSCGQRIREQIQHHCGNWREVICKHTLYVPYSIEHSTVLQYYLHTFFIICKSCVKICR